MTTSASQHQQLAALAADAMRARGLEPSFPPDALAQAASVEPSSLRAGGPVRDLRDHPWCSIDNDDSRDLDQLSVSEQLADGRVRMLVAVADVDVAAPLGTPIDRHAAVNTTSVYTPAAIFPMLPPRLSTDLTSLNANVDRRAVVVEYIVAPDGTLETDDVYGARVRNHAHLVYDEIDSFLAGRGPLPKDAQAPGIREQLEMQDRVAQSLGRRRHELGALDFEIAETRVRFDHDRLRDLRPELPNRAKSLIENLMIAANGVVARFLDRRGSPSIRRVVQAPERWDRIVAIAAGYGHALPAAPDSLALAQFLRARKAADPDDFPELSHAIIRLVGAGQYLVDTPATEAPGHFALAVKDYAHSTAPNRRYSDLLTQRLLKAVLRGDQPPYSIDALTAYARSCTLREDDANRVERQVRKSAAAMLVAHRIGQRFRAVVTGASPKGTYVRTLAPHIEGRVVRGERGVDVGDRVSVELTAVDVPRGFIDFAI
ncbi:MAG TPA: RNB domain-containing ribonuclease [Vicinamibacterales bacterium]|nr:RNB domain-containing ribonuclease [Vicinamibacterales bacterium]